MNKMLKSVIFMAAMIAAVSSFAEIVHHDDKDFYVDEQGVEHQLFYEKGNAAKIWSLSTYADQAFQIPSPLTPDGILVTLQSETYAASWPFGFTCYGIDLRKGIGAKWEGAHHFGAYGIRSSVGGWTLQFYSGSLNLVASQTWTGPEATELSANPFIIKTTHDSYPGAYKGGVLADADGLALTLAGDMRLVLRDETTDLPTTDVIVQKPAVLSLVSFSSGKGCLHARTLTLDGGTGFYFGQKKSGDSYGSIAELSVERVARTLELKNDASLTAYGTTSVSVTGGVTVVAAEGSTGSVVGTYVLKDDETVFKAEEDATLDLTGATLSGGAMSVQGPGTVEFDFDKNVTAGGVSFGGGCALVLSGSTGALMDSLADLSAIEIAASGVVEIGDAAMATYCGTDIEVSSGTLFVPSASSIPAGVRIVTSGTGALCLRDATGFDKTTQMGGTQALVDGSSGLFVTDVPRTDETIVVGAGETLSVMGNGLAASSIVDLRLNARIAFYETATAEASFVATNGAVDVVTMSSAVTSTVSGVINSQGGTLRITSPGLVRFLGGGKMGTFKLLSGEAEVGGANYLGYGTISMVSGHLLVTSLWQFDQKWIDVNLAQTQTGDVTLEIGPGGDLYIARGSCYVYIGKDPNWKSRLYINGGVFSCDIAERFCLNCMWDGSKTDYAGNGIIEIDNGGEFANAMLIRSSATSGPQAGIILGNGTWSSRKAWAYRYQYGVLINEGDCPVTVRGRITFDMSNFKPENLVVTNQSASATGVWTCETGGRVSVTGGRTLVFRDVPEMALDLTRTPVGNVVFCNSAAEEEEVPPTAVTWTIPKTGAKTGAVTATGEGGKTGPLVASYVVPEDVTFDGSQTNGWYEGFTSQTLGSLVFEAGSAYRFAPFAADFAPLALAGTLTLPEAMDYYLTADGARRDFRSEPVIVPALGVEGDCVWTCRGDKEARPKNAALSVADDRLVLDYTLPGVLLLVR